MKAHRGMRPLDIVVLSKIVVLGNNAWQIRDLSSTLGISISEISESLNRSQLARLVDNDKKKVFTDGFVDFLEHGLPYVFPIQPGTIVTGLATAISHPSFAEQFSSSYQYVWAYDDGDIRGISIEPLHAGVPNAALMDQDFYLLMSAIEVLRMGKPREKELALTLIKNILNEYNTVNKA